MMKKLMLVAALLCVVFLYGVYTIFGSTPFLRKSYFVEAWWAKNNIHCQHASLSSKNILEKVISDYGSLSNQLIYFKKNGTIESCVSGFHVDDDTRFRYASLTKVITAAFFLENEKLGLINREDYLQQYIKLENSADERIHKIQLFNLLTHTSGFDRTKSNDPIIQEGKSWCPDHLEKLGNIRLDYASNTKYSYDNRNYCILGAVLAKKIGQPFNVILNDYLALHHFNHIKFIDGPFMQDEVNYDFRFEEYYFPSYTQKYDFYAMQSAAGLSGSAKDYARLIHYFIDQRKLPLTQTVLEITDTAKITHTLSIGLQQITTSKGEVISYHFGALPASRSMLIIRGNGDILVWTGNGVPENKNNTDSTLLKYIIDNF
ncbi:serine hydrolase domain-containing protein [Acinetobacter pragensis]|uniref:serine hydrolase domain-containing protein n=1 Tax=Acinetobacter pragensis TaxID=1806892 RepID=UPI0033408394